MKESPITLKYYLLPIVTVVCTSTSGCSTSGMVDDVKDERFVTEIKSDGSKLFTYGISFSGQENNKSLHSPAANRPTDRELFPERGEGQGRRSDSRPAGLSHGRGGGDSQQQAMLDALYEKLAVTLAQTGFCRDGYFELDRYLSRNTAQVKGECNESASDKDKQRFSR